MSDKIDQGALADAIRLGVAEYERLREDGGEWNPHRWSVIGENPETVYEYRNAKECRSHRQNGTTRDWLRGLPWLAVGAEREIPPAEAEALIEKWAAERKAKEEKAKRPALPEQREYHYERDGVKRLAILTDDADYRLPKRGEPMVINNGCRVLVAMCEFGRAPHWIPTLIDPPKPTQELLDEGELDIDGDYPVKPNVGDIFVDYRGRHKCRSCRPETLKPFHHGYRWLLKKREPKLRYARDGCDIRDAVSDDCIANVWDTNCAQHVVDALNAYDQGCKQ